MLLLGGSDEDNLFQIPVSAEVSVAAFRHSDCAVHNSETLNLEYQLNKLVASGGNFVRCTMSSRDLGDVWPYAMDRESKTFDLDAFDEEYWMRFERFLRMTRAREVFVQVEVWATYDYYQREVRPGVFPWHMNPFNPRNNVNYTSQESGLPEDLPSNGCSAINPFFETVPALHNNRRILCYQQAYVDRLLSISLGFDHVLYCIDNETNAHPEWPAYWAQYLHDHARAAGVGIEVTEMWDTFDPTNGAVEGARRQPLETNPFVVRSTPLNCLQRPDIYSFSDISNHNAQRGETHYRTGWWFWQRIQKSGRVWPVHCDKMYGGDSLQSWAGSRKDGLERFWRNIFAGLAGCRFHRPRAGLGLDDEACTHMRAMRLLTDELSIFTCQPRPDLLSMREENTAFCLADVGRAYAVVFVNPGSCVLDVGAMGAKVIKVRWLDIERLRWSAPEPRPPLASIELRPPGPGYWAVLVDEDA
ncbi:MAG: hypothetical protein ACYC5M_02585 [Anaerolineae bacterium]